VHQDFSKKSPFQIEKIIIIKIEKKVKRVKSSKFLNWQDEIKFKY